MSLAEINIFIEENSKAKSESDIILAWKTINFLSLMISGKLKDLVNYLPKKKTVIKTGQEKLIDKAKEKARQLGHL